MENCDFFHGVFGLIPVDRNRIRRAGTDSQVQVSLDTSLLSITNWAVSWCGYTALCFICHVVSCPSFFPLFAESVLMALLIIHALGLPIWNYIW